MKKRLLFGFISILILFTLITPVSAAIEPTTSWGPMIKKDATFTWKITDLEDENGTASWTWAYLGADLAKDDEISYTWNEVNDTVYTPRELYLEDSLTGVMVPVVEEHMMFL